MNDPDLSTKLKLMGVDVASFGDFFADERLIKAAAAAAIVEAPGVVVTSGKPSKRARDTRNDPTKCLTYLDPFSSTYFKFIFTADGQHLLGGIMVGDTSSFTKMVAIVKKKKKLDVPPSDFIIGAKKAGEEDGGDLDDDAVVCSCHVSSLRLRLFDSTLTILTQNVQKGDIGKCIKEGVTDLGLIKKKTKAGAGCGGCVALVTNIYKAEMKKAGHAVSSACVPSRLLHLSSSLTSSPQQIVYPLQNESSRLVLRHQNQETHFVQRDHVGRRSRSRFSRMRDLQASDRIDSLEFVQ